MPLYFLENPDSLANSNNVYITPPMFLPTEFTQIKVDKKLEEELEGISG